MTVIDKGSVTRKPSWAKDIKFIIGTKEGRTVFPAHSEEQKDRVLKRWSARGLTPWVKVVVDA